MIHWLVSFNRRLCKRLTRTFPRLIYWGDDIPKRLNEITVEYLKTLPTAAAVLEVGGADRPLMKREGLQRYDCVDPDDSASRCASYDSYFCQSIEERVPFTYDLICSESVLEHVPNNSRSTASMFAALKPGGMMVHYLPSRYHPYALGLRLISHRLQRKLIRHFEYGTPDRIGYRTFFSHCSPRAMRKLLCNRGFTNIRIEPYYSAHTYFEFLFPLYVVVVLFEIASKHMKLATLCSGFILTAIRPRHDE